MVGPRLSKEFGDRDLAVSDRPAAETLGETHIYIYIYLAVAFKSVYILYSTGPRTWSQHQAVQDYFPSILPLFSSYKCL